MSGKVASSKERSSPRKKGVNKVAVALPALLILAAFMLLPGMMKDISDQNAAATKPFSTFEAFYPFYVSQHQEDTCRRLHFIGTTLALIFAMWEPYIVPSLALGGMAGYVMFFLTRGVSHGFFEMGAAFGIFFYFMYHLTGKMSKAVAMLAIPYGFAWVGHFFFEHNKPATFIYPIFSLLGDFKLWYEIATQQRAF